MHQAEEEASGRTHENYRPLVNGELDSTKNGALLWFSHLCPLSFCVLPSPLFLALQSRLSSSCLLSLVLSGVFGLILLIPVSRSGSTLVKCSTADSLRFFSKGVVVTVGGLQSP